MAFFVEILPCIHMIRYIVTSKNPTKIDSTSDDGLFMTFGDSTPAPFSVWCQTQRQGNDLGFQPILHCAKGSRLEPTHLQQEGGTGSVPWEQFESYTFLPFRWFDGHNFSVVALKHLGNPSGFKPMHRCRSWKTKKIGYPTALISAPHSTPLGTCLHLPTHTHFLRTAYRFVKVECIRHATDTNKQKQIDTVNTYNII